MKHFFVFQTLLFLLETLFYKYHTIGARIEIHKIFWNLKEHISERIYKKYAAYRTKSPAVLYTWCFKNACKVKLIQKVQGVESTK